VKLVAWRDSLLQNYDQDYRNLHQMFRLNDTSEVTGYIRSSRDARNMGYDNVLSDQDSCTPHGTR
jgi:hypothetical protein